MARSYRPGIDAARWLLDELVQRLGVEPEWSVGDGDSIRWSAGPFCTLFTLADTGVHTPHLARLTIATDAAFDGELTIATNITNDFNGVTGLTRWVVRPDEAEGEFTVAVVSSFLVTPDTVSGLLPLVEAAVREQVATVTAKITNDVHADWGGEAAVVEGEDGPRPPQVWNRVVHHFDDAVSPFVDDPGTVWHADVEAAWAEFDAAMAAYPMRWTGQVEPDQLTLSVPLRVPSTAAGRSDAAGKPDAAGRSDAAGKPDAVGKSDAIGKSDAVGKPDAIGRSDAVSESNEDTGLVPDALLQAGAERNPVLGNGLLVVLAYPGVQADAEVAAARAAAFNLRAVERPSVGHLLGAWSARGEELYWTAFLPSGLHRQLTEPARRLVVRELLSAASREAQLAHCLDDGDERSLIGFERFTDTLGPAYGEDHAPVDLPLGVLDRLSRELTGSSASYVVNGDDGFTWWAGVHPQTVRVRSDGGSADRSGPVAVEVSTRVRQALGASVGVLGTLTRMATRLARCRVVLLEDGSVDLHAVVPVRAALARVDLARVWEQATEQLVLAERIAATVARLGGAAPAPHPVQGVRVDRARLLTLLPLVRDNAEKATAVAGSALALALGYLFAPTLGVLDHDPGRALTFCWLTSSVPSPVGDPAGPGGLGGRLLRTVVRVGSDPDVGPGILVRTALPAGGSAAQRAAWCNRTNLDLALAGVPSPGGFGTDGDGQVLLTGWLGAGAFGDDPARSLGELLSVHQRAIVDALAVDPEFVVAPPPQPEELDRLVATLPGALGSVLAVPTGTVAGVSALPGASTSLLLRMECPLGEEAGDEPLATQRLAVGVVLPDRTRVVAVTIDGTVPGFGELALLWSWLLETAGAGTEVGTGAGIGTGAEVSAVGYGREAETVAAALADLVREGALVPATGGRPLTEQPMVGPGGTVVTVELAQSGGFGGSGSDGGYGSEAGYGSDRGYGSEAGYGSGEALELVVRLREAPQGLSMVAQPDADGATLRVGVPVAVAGWHSTEAVVAATRTLVEQTLRQAAG